MYLKYTEMEGKDEIMKFTQTTQTEGRGRSERMIDWLKHVSLELHWRRRNETHRTGMPINMVSYWMLHAPISHAPEKKITNWPKCPDQRFDLILCRLSFIDTVVYSRLFFCAIQRLFIAFYSKIRLLFWNGLRGNKKWTKQKTTSFQSNSRTRSSMCGFFPAIHHIHLFLFIFCTSFFYLSRFFFFSSHQHFTFFLL